MLFEKDDKKKTKFRGKTKKKYRKYTQKRRLFSFVDTTRSLPTPKSVLPTEIHRPKPIKAKFFQICHFRTFVLGVIN